MLIAVLIAAFAAAPALDADIKSVAAIKGDPHIVAAAGLTKEDVPILTLEDGDAFEPNAAAHRLAIVGIGRDDRTARAVLDAVRWFKTTAPASARRQWRVAALPSAAFEPSDTVSLDRWVTFQLADVVLQVVDDGGAAGGDGAVVKVTAADAVARVRTIVAATPARSAQREAMLARLRRSPIDIAQLLARRYPASPVLSYIPAVAWTSTLRLATLTNDPSLVAKVPERASTLVKDGQLSFGNRIQLTSVAGTMVFAELGGEHLPQALEGARLAAAKKEDGLAEYGQGWTDDMFMASAILARVGSMPDHRDYHDRLSRLLLDYAARLQRPDGIFVHATDGPFAWGRGNGFAALGLMEALTALPERHPDRPRLLAIFERHMAALASHQSPDGSWREVIDEPGAYREETATAMLMTAMARGIRLGWISRRYLPVVERAWRAVAAHVRDDGTLVDVCTGTGAGPTRRYYLDRAAISGADDRGGAMALLAAMEWNELRRPSSRPRAANSSAPRIAR